MTDQFHVPSTILIGGGVRHEAAAQLRQFGVERVLLVTDASMLRLGPAREIAELLKATGLAVALFDGVQPAPTDRNVLDGLVMFQAERCQGIVAVGGGSPIDAAKAISVLTTNPPQRMTQLRTICATCRPRADVEAGTTKDEQFALFSGENPILLDNFFSSDTIVQQTKMARAL